MRRIISLFMALMLCVFALAACDNEADKELDRFVIPEPVTVSAKDGFDNSGFVMHVCEQSGYYDFSAVVPENSEIVWSVYLLDEEFADAARYIPHAYTSSLDGSGLLYIDSGRYIYTYCSNNIMSDSSAVDGASYTYSFVESESIKYTVKSEDSYEGCGFTSWKCDADGTYRVDTVNGAQNVEWTVFVLDSEFDDANRYIPQAYAPTLNGSGQIDIKAGQYVYIQCSANDFTEDGPVSGCALFIRAL